MVRRSQDSISRTLENFDVATAIHKEANEIEALLEGQTVSAQTRQKVRDVLTLARNLKTDADPDIPLILRAIYQLRGVFNPARNATIESTGRLTLAQRNAERARLRRRLDEGGVSKEELQQILKRADELNAMK